MDRGALNLLLVDDDAPTRRGLRRLLSSRLEGCAMTECGDGDEALEMMVAHRYDCVVLDYQLPGRNGLEVLRGARAAGVTSPVVVLTGEGSEELAVEMIRAGADEYLVKLRLTPDGLARAIRHAVRVREAEARAATARAGQAASEARFRSLFEASPLAIELSVDGVTLYVNPAYLRMFGFGRVEEVIGSRVVDRVAPTARGMIADRMARRDRGERVPDAYETAGVRRDGEEFPLHIRIARTATAEGMAHLAFIADLSEQKRAEAALSETSRTLEGVFAASPLAMAVMDRAGYVRMWNPAAERVFGWSEAEVLGRMFPLVTAADDRDQFNDLHERLLAGHGFEGIEGSVRRKGGGMVDISASGAPLTGADGEVTGIVLVCADMTEANRLRWQLLQSQKMESLGRLAGGIAHDFNNLLAVIGGYAESVRRRVGEGHAARPQVEEIERAAERGARLVRQLLAFSRSRPVRTERVDVTAVIGEVCQMLRRVIGSKIAVERCGDGRPAWVEADPGQVEQMLVNLALNARDAMPEGGTLAFETTHLDVPAVAGSRPAGRFVALVVRDTGKGMDGPTQSRAFEPFFTTKAEGTGLGLSIVYGIVRQMGGHVSLSSEPGRGTRFEILLPAAAPSSSP